MYTYVKYTHRENIYLSMYISSMHLGLPIALTSASVASSSAVSHMYTYM